MCLILAKNLLWSHETSAFPLPHPNSLHPCALNSEPSPSISLWEIHNVIKAKDIKGIVVSCYSYNRQFVSFFSVLLLVSLAWKTAFKSKLH